jgi:hypothetical protein
MGQGIQGSAASKQGITEMNQTPVGLYICPSRRAVKTYPFNGSGFTCAGGQPNNCNGLAGTNVGKSDYAANCGNGTANSADPGDDQADSAGPSNYAGGDPPNSWPDYGNPNDPTYYQGGMCYVRSQVTQAQVLRGTSHVILLGEKYMDGAHYTDGQDCGDNEELFVGQDNDLYRTTYQVPQQDLSGQANTNAFGSTHAGGCNFSAGDGSIHFVGYDVNLTIFQAFGQVNDVITQGTIWAY